MRRSGILIIAALGLTFAIGVSSVHAQGDIRNVSFRPTDAMAPGTGAGSVDISAAADGTYTVSVDISGQTEALILDEYLDATAFVVWGVDMQGAEHNIGTLTADLVLEGASIDYLVSALLLSAEVDAATTTRQGEILFSLTLRQVDRAAAAAATATTAAPEPTAVASPAASEAPKELPTTGQLLRDLAVLAAVGFVLLVGGLQLKRTRPV